MIPKVLCFTLLFALSGAPAGYSLSVEEVLKLKKAGVTDQTIRMLVQQEQQDTFIAERTGIWKTRDGRVIRTTPSIPYACHQGYYPVYLYPYIRHPHYPGPPR